MKKAVLNRFKYIDIFLTYLYKACDYNRQEVIRIQNEIRGIK